MTLNVDRSRPEVRLFERINLTLSVIILPLIALGVLTDVDVDAGGFGLPLLIAGFFLWNSYRVRRLQARRRLRSTDALINGNRACVNGHG